MNSIRPFCYGSCAGMAFTNAMHGYWIAACCQLFVLVFGVGLSFVLGEHK